MTTWRNLILMSLKADGESWKDIESCTLTDSELDISFDNGYGGSEGLPFTVWTKQRGYFPLVYDGAEWVGSVSRHPDGKPTPHQGGQ